MAAKGSRTTLSAGRGASAAAGIGLKSRDFEAALQKLLKNHDGSAPLRPVELIRACRVLAECLEDNEPAIMRAQEAGLLPALLQVLRAEEGSGGPQLLVSVLAAFTNSITQSGGRPPESAIACEIITACLRTHMGDLSVAQAALRALGELAGNLTNARTLVSIALDVLVDAVARHVRDRVVATFGGMALCGCARVDEENGFRSIVGAGLVRVFVALLSRHPDSEPLVGMTCGMLCNVCAIDSSNVSVLLVAGAREAASDALRKSVSRHVVATIWCTNLLAVCARAGGMGPDTALAQAALAASVMKHHLDEPSAMLSACELAKLSILELPDKDEAAPDAVATLVRVMLRYSGRADIANHALCALSHLQLSFKHHTLLIQQKAGPACVLFQLRSADTELAFFAACICGTMANQRDGRLALAAADGPAQLVAAVRRYADRSEGTMRIASHALEALLKMTPEPELAPSLAAAGCFELALGVMRRRTALLDAAAADPCIRVRILTEYTNPWTTDLRCEAKQILASALQLCGRVSLPSGAAAATVAAVLETFGAWAHDADISNAAAGSLGLLIRDHTAEVSCAQLEAVCTALVQALQATVGGTDAAFDVLRAVWSVMFARVESRPMLLAAGAAAALVAMAERQAEHSMSVAYFAVDILGSLPQTETDCELVMRAGVLRAIAAAAALHADDAAFAQPCCLSIQKLAGFEIGRTSMLASGAGALVVDLMRRHGQTDTVTRLEEVHLAHKTNSLRMQHMEVLSAHLASMGCAALRNLCASKESRLPLMAAGAGDIVLRMLELHGADDVRVASSGLGALFGLACEPANCAALQAGGAIVAAVRGIRHTSRHWQIAWAACGVLLRLAQAAAADGDEDRLVALFCEGEMNEGASVDKGKGTVACSGGDALVSASIMHCRTLCVVSAATAALKLLAAVPLIAAALLKRYTPTVEESEADGRGERIAALRSVLALARERAPAAAAASSDGGSDV